MGKVKRYGCRRGTDIQHRGEALQFVMSRLVEEVAESNHARGLTREVHRKLRGTPAEHAGYRVQFLAAAAKIVPCYDKVGSVEGCTCSEQECVLTIPESMA